MLYRYTPTIYLEARTPAHADRLIRQIVSTRGLSEGVSVDLGTPEIRASVQAACDRRAVLIARARRLQFAAPGAAHDPARVQALCDCLVALANELDPSLASSPSLSTQE